jgi:hypothetical protein
MKNKFAVLAGAALLAAVLISGCATPAPNVGFPLIDIVSAEVDIEDSRFAKEDTKWERGENTKIIGGIYNTVINPRDITIKLIETSFQVAIRNGEDVTPWFLNIPNGMIATAKAIDPEAKHAVVQGDTEILITISGNPQQVINQPIRIKVPYQVTNRLWDFIIPPNQDLRFEVYAATLADVVIGGAVNRDIEPKTFQIGFGGTVLKETVEQNTDITSWFTNIPRGLKAVVAEDTVPLSADQQKRVAGSEPQQQTLLVTVSGRPTNQSRENVKVNIPPGITVANIALNIPPEYKARYDIGSFASAKADDVELRTGTNWGGVQPGWGLSGPDVYKLKDFTAVGIIQITSQTVEKMGVDGLYHWTGEAITYGKLMAEAKKLGAHAIIDVVIDQSDVIDEEVIRRHVEADHEFTPREAAMYAAKTLVIEDDPSDKRTPVVIDGKTVYLQGKIYKETVKVTTRTWTGTALAITYAPAYQPTVGDGGATGYIPALPNEKWVPVPSVR